MSQQTLTNWLWVLGLVVTLLALLLLRRKPKAEFYYIVCAAFSWGIILFLYVPPYFKPELARSLADAFVIAALLAVSVDRYVKGRVLHEVTADVSKYLIGYRLPEQLQERLHSIMQTQWIVRAFEVRIRIQETRLGQMELDWTLSYRIQNITSELLAYLDVLSFSKHERVHVVEQRCERDSGALEYHRDGEEVKPHEDEGQLVLYGPFVKIPPAAKTSGDYRFSARYTVIRPATPERSITIKNPTIEATIEVTDCPPDFVFHLTPAPDQSSHHRWTYSRLFLPGEQIRIQWDRQTGVQA